MSKISLIENSLNSERNFNYSNFFAKIQVHLLNRLHLLLEYKICNSLNKNYLILESPLLKPSDWMQKLLDDTFESILKFKTKSSPATQRKIEQIFIRKFNLFLIKIYELTYRQQKKSIEHLKASFQFYMNWIAHNYSQHLNTINFPNCFLELLEHNLHFDDRKSPINHSSQLNRANQINRNQIAPIQSANIYESNICQTSNNFESSSFTEHKASFRNVHFKSDVEQKLKFSNKKSYFKLLCFD